MERTIIPQHVVLELLGNIRFAKDEEKDVAIAEQIAGGEYGTLLGLIETCRGFVEVKHKLFEKAMKEVKNSDFYKPYL